MSASQSRVLLTVGDPHGIGPEVAVAAAAELNQSGGPVPVLVGPRRAVEEPAARAGVHIRELDDAKLPHPEADTLDLVPSEFDGPFCPGRPTAVSGRATVAAIQVALELLHNGRGHGIVACPHSQTAVAAAGMEFAGYPSLLADLCGVSRDDVFLMLEGAGLRIVHATLHESLRGALDRLTPELVARAGHAAAHALATRGIAVPRIGVLGINPHAGEDGLFGADDEHVTAPAVRMLQNEGIDAHGPVGADLMLSQAGLDAFVALYHDQGHIPVKLLAGRTASALSIGAGIVFSSVGHGAAFDIVGNGAADATATVRAIRLVAGATPSQQRPHMEVSS